MRGMAVADQQDIWFTQAFRKTIFTIEITELVAWKQKALVRAIWRIVIVGKNRRQRRDAL